MDRRSTHAAPATLLSVALIVGGCATRTESVKQDSVPVPAPVVAHPAFAQTDGQPVASIADIAERSLPSVVNVSSTKVVKQQGVHMSPFFNDPFFRHFFGNRHGSMGPGVPRARREMSLGSGVIVNEDGTVLTNNHVVAHADKIKVTLSDKREFDAKVVGTDPRSDLAVLKLEGDVKGLQPLSFGDSSRLRLGDVVIAIGNPFGVGQTVTMGIVSAKGRADMGIVDYEDFIQTDAAINPGNSGGALIDMNGDLVGINTAILSRSGGYQGIGFAIPSNMARPIMTSLRTHGKVVRGWLGVAIQDLRPDMATALGVKATTGVLVSDVAPDSPAEKAGLKRGDIVLNLNGEELDSSGRLRNLVAAAGAKAEVKLDILRGNEKLTVNATLAEMPITLGGVAKLDPDDGVLGGLTVTSLNEASRDKYRIPSRIKHGIVIQDVAHESRAAQAGIRPGDVILEVNRQPVQDAGRFASLYEAAHGQLLLLVYREGNTLFLLLHKD